MKCVIRADGEYLVITGNGHRDFEWTSNLESASVFDVVLCNGLKVELRPEVELDDRYGCRIACETWELLPVKLNQIELA